MATLSRKVFEVFVSKVPWTVAGSELFLILIFNTAFILCASYKRMSVH